MSENSKIEWTDHTFNPWIGCTKVSPGCAHCYAEARDKRLTKGGNAAHWGKGAPRQRTSAATWRNPVKWNDEAKLKEEELAPWGEYQKPRVFPSLCDWLDPEVPIEWLSDFLQLIHDTPNLDWLLLTKRPELFLSRTNDVVVRHIRKNASFPVDFVHWLDNWRRPSDRIPNNVWIGTSVEDQKRADERIPALLQIPAAIRFLSCEPLLGPIDLITAFPITDRHCQRCGFKPIEGMKRYREIHGDEAKCVSCDFDLSKPATCVDWVIVGGESGPEARPCHVQFIRDIVAECEFARVPVFVKQLGAQPLEHDGDLACWPDTIRWGKRDNMNLILLDHAKGGDPAEWPEELRVREFPKLEVTA